MEQPEQAKPTTLSPLPNHTRPWCMLAVLIFSDILILALAGFVTVEGRLYFHGRFHPSLYWNLWPAFGLFVLTYAILGLYPAVAMSPTEELRRLSWATTIVYLCLGSVTFVVREAEVYSRAIFLVAWLFSLFLVPLNRALVRGLFARAKWWGYPVIIFGAGKTGNMVVRNLTRQPRLGLKPVAILDDDPAKHGHLQDIPVIGKIENAPLLAKELKITYAIVAMPGIPRERLLEIIGRYGQGFPRLFIIPDLFGCASLWVTASDLGGILGLELSQQLLLRWPMFLKAVSDILFTVIGSIFILPLLLFLAVLIKLDSRGPVFYGHKRIGYGGKYFKAWKFRSMVRNADQILKEYLERNPDLRQEWEADQKLKNDPRITRIGHFLRKSSLDELPQLWNVVRGEMSLVGPRPIVDNEIAKYGDKYELYLRVKPGITGLWQVSGRNNTTYEERVNLDAYYVRNWSVWLDIYILARTVKEVILREGAY